MLLYIHIPFCASKCGYCAFTSFIGEESYFESYVEALCVDLAYTLSIQNYHLDSIFIGGGTPNLLASKFYKKIFALLAKYAHIDKDCEISIEANVNILNTQWCKDLRALGVNRLSVGVQSFYEPKLAFLERDHSTKDIFYHIQSAYNAGFTNLSCDMMITPLDNQEILESELTQAMNLPINHISVYALSIDEGSRFASQEVMNNKVCESSKDETLSFFARDILKNAGFMQYEVSNYVKNGTNAECRHNLGYWQGKEYLGCGAAAVGRIGDTRMKAYPQLKGYIASPTQRFIESLSQRDMCLERIMLGLRCKSGARICDIEQLFAKRHFMQECVKNLLEGNKCYIRKERGEEFLVANELFLADEIVLWLLSREQ